MSLNSSSFCLNLLSAKLAGRQPCTRTGKKNVLCRHFSLVLFGRWKLSISAVRLKRQTLPQGHGCLASFPEISLAPVKYHSFSYKSMFVTCSPDCPGKLCSLGWPQMQRSACLSSPMLRLSKGVCYHTQCGFPSICWSLYLWGSIFKRYKDMGAVFLPLEFQSAETASVSQDCMLRMVAQ